jgi:hypothetical protein
VRDPAGGAGAGAVAAAGDASEMTMAQFISAEEGIREEQREEAQMAAEKREQEEQEAARADEENEAPPFTFERFGSLIFNKIQDYHPLPPKLGNEICKYAECKLHVSP